MTDSMKFGPEWLRNMSADTANTSGATNSANSSTNTTYGSPTAPVNNLSGNGSGGSGAAHLHATATSSMGGSINSVGVSTGNQATAPRNLFPEFRYGREEMLSLFEKHCHLPEILPTYKKIFVDKVQYPLALVPSTDEELITQGPVVSTPRPAWLRRSPVGFGTSTRGTGRGGSVERGRLRGKSVYHTIYQRPTAMFEDDIRSNPLKSERSWSERNGATGPDALFPGVGAAGVGHSGAVNVSGSNDWNGTPASSPRKEFSSHNRNLENWRRNRHDDGASEATTRSALVEGPIDGWRGGSSGGGNVGSSSFGSSHRWGRSTSWRDEEISNSTNNDVGYVGGSGNIGSGFNIQRSYSTISTSMTERTGGNYAGGASGSILQKNAISSYNVNSSGRALNSYNGGGNLAFRGSATAGGSSQWNPNMNNSNAADADDSLPEWATENPTDGGGSFDATGAFHGCAVEDDDAPTSRDSGAQHAKAQQPTSSNDRRNNENSDKHDIGREEPAKTVVESVAANTHSQAEAVHSISSTNSTPSVHDDDEHQREPRAETENKDAKLNIGGFGDFETTTADGNISNYFHMTSSADAADAMIDVASATVTTAAYSDSGSSVPKNLARTTPVTPITIPPTGNVEYQQQQAALHIDFSDRMKEVADDMVEKLIMDDDNATVQHTKNVTLRETPTFANSRAHLNDAIADDAAAFISPAVSAILKQTAAAPHTSGVVSVSPTLKAIPLYGGGVVIDHATIQQHHMQQQQLAAAAAAAGVPTPHHGMSNSAASNDLWYYRDPQSKVQGPFTAIEMTEWYRAGYFNENLYVRRVCDARFRALGELIKLCRGNMPFTHSQLIPPIAGLGLVDNIAAPVVLPAAAADVATPGGSTPTLAVKQQQQHHHHQHQQQQQQQQHTDPNVHDDLEGNVAAAADSISTAVKNLISSVDMSHTLNMHFQMLQEQYLRHQEMLITADLSHNECFQRLSPPEREHIVRGKVQLLPLPEYLTSFPALSNLLATLNPTGGIQIYDLIVVAQQQQQQQQHHQQQPTHLVDADDFMLNAHQQQQAAAQFPAVGLPGPAYAAACANAELAGELYLRMLLRGVCGSNHNDATSKAGATQAPPSASGHSGDYLNEQQLLVAATNPTTMWLQQQQPTQTQMLIAQPTQQTPVVPSCHGQWAGGPLVGIPSAVMGNVTAALQQPTTVWDMSNTHKEQHPQLESSLLQQQEQIENKDPQATQLKGVTTQQATQETQPHVDMPQQLENAPAANKPRKDEQQLQQNTNKRTNNKQPTKQPQAATPKDELLVSNNQQRKSDEERRRESTEEKRRQKEERRRQQADEEKRRLQQAEDEKQRQIAEEKERQQQIQAQRRKALLGTAANPPGSSSNAVAAGAPQTTGSGKSNQQRIQTSVAPWSIQTVGTAVGGKAGPPCLAEIQKAERRERRADQQRQMELLEKQMRATAAASAEAIDSMLKWHASPVAVPVKSFAEIQAEEAKRLAAELLELQRRKQQEQEQQQAAALVSSLGVGNGNPLAAVVAGNTPGACATATSNISAIWGASAGVAAAHNSKIWPAGFWEEPVKFSAAVAGGGVTTAAAVVAATTGAGSKSLQSSQQQKSAAGGSARNLRKSQTVSVMQNSNAGGGAVNGKNTAKIGHQNTSKQQQQTHKLQQQQTQKANDGDKKTGTNEKKSNFNANSGGGASVSAGNSAAGDTATQKRGGGDDLENEFTTWCTKSLNNMNAKVDVPTFVMFLQDLESPYEVKDYIRVYLGENKEFMEFAKQFLERRSRYKNLQRAQNAHNDDMCKPAPAITPSTGNDNSDNKGKQKKVKKNKMTKLDARILGFSVTAAEGRINVGDRDYVDAP